MVPQNFVKIGSSQIFMAAKIFIASIFRGKILWSLKITSKIWSTKKIFIHIKFIGKFYGLDFYQKFRRFYKKVSKKMALGAIFLPFNWPKFWAGKILAKKFCFHKFGQFSKFTLINKLIRKHNFWRKFRKFFAEKSRILILVNSLY